MSFSIKQKWNELLSIGRQGNHHYLDVQRIALLNAIAVSTIVMSVFVTIIYTVLGFHRYVALLIIPMSLTVLWFNKKNKAHISKDIAFFGFLTIIVIWSFFTRRSSAILLLMVLCCGSAFLYIKKITIYLRIFICCIVYLYYVYYDHVTPFVPNPDINYPAINIILTLLTCGLLLFYIMLSVDLIKHSSIKISNQLEALNIAFEKQKETDQKLKASNEELIIFNTKLDYLVKKSNEELYAYQSAINDNLYSVVTDYDGTILKMNAVYLEKIGYTEKEIQGKNIDILKTDSHSDEFYDDINKTIFAGKVWRGESKIRKKNGDYFWLVSSILPIKMDSGQIKSFLTISANVTEKKMAEEEQRIAYEYLVKSGNRLNLVLDNQSDLVVITNKLGMRKYVNIAFCNFFGKDKNYFIGTNYKTLNPENVSTTYLRLFENLSFENPKITFLDVIVNVNGEKRWIVWNELALFDTNKEISEIFSIGHDITELKQIEFENANSLAQFEEMAFKTSHKFRGPLSSIMGIVNLLENNDISDSEIKDVSAFIKEATNSLDLASRDLAAFIDTYQSKKYNPEKSNKNNIDFTEAKSKHLNWRYKIRNFIDGTGSLTQNQAISERYSDLGKWFYSIGKEKYGHIPSIQKFEIENEKLHRLVKEILELKLNQNIEESELKYAELINTSDTIILLLDESEKGIDS